MAELTIAQMKAIALANARARAAAASQSQAPAQAPPPTMAQAQPVATAAMPPANLKPGTREYAQWAVQQAKAGNKLPQVTKVISGTDVQGPNGPSYVGAGQMNSLPDQVMAGYTSAVDALPIVGPYAMGGLEALKANAYHVPQGQLAQEDKAREAANPIASGTGFTVGTLLPFVAGGEVPMIAKGLGMDASMGLLARTALSAGTNAAISGADAAVRGQDPVTGALLGGAGGAIAPGAGDLLGAWAGRIAAKAQNRAVDAAIKSGPAGAQELRDAGSQMFQQAFANKGGPMIASPALDRLWNDVEMATSKYRANPTNDPQAVGLLSHVSGLMDAAKTPGTVVDLQDLHLARQLASQVAQKPGREGAIGSIVLNRIDAFVKSLKPNDILGNMDPRTAVNGLMNGISTWNRAVKAGVIESAIEKAQGYKSGVELGLKSTFSNLMKSRDWSRFTQVEQDAIRQVAKGTPLQNVASLFGKMGISLGGSGAHNIVGAGVGTMGLAAGLTPFLGPFALPAAAIGTTVAGAAGRSVAENAAESGARRAVQVVATPGIPATMRPSVSTWGPEALQALLKAAPLGMIPPSGSVAVPR